MINQSQITRILKHLHSSISNDINGLTQMFNRFLQVQQPYLITFMNNQFFRSDDNLILYLTKSISQQNNKSEQQVRKTIYIFVSDYIATFKQYLGDYLKGLFQKFYALFKQQTSAKTKQKSLGPIREILLNYNNNDLDGVLQPVTLHNNLTNLLKIQSIKSLPSSVRGQIWIILGILQNNFALSISYNKKKQVQIISLSQLKTLINSDKNITTIANILKSFAYSLNENHLDDKQLEQLFNHTKAVMIPLKATFDASIAALNLLSSQSTLFHPFIMKNSKNLFQNLIGLMSHHNKQYKFALLDTLAIIVKQIVIGISTNTQDDKNLQLFNFIGNSMWRMLQSQAASTQLKNQQKTKFNGNAISIVKILGILSPLILNINGMNDLKKFFHKLLLICNHKVTKAFQNNDNSLGNTQKIYAMKLILYNQKQLVSFIGSFAKILQQIDQLSDTQALKLQNLFLIAIQQYPYFLQKYKPDLIQSMVQFLMGLSTKPHTFTWWSKKMICLSLMQSLDTKKFKLTNDNDYYLMIKKSSKMWNSLLTHQLWSGIVLKQFSKYLFESLQNLFLNLDISYKTHTQLEIQDDQHQLAKQQEIQLANIFFLIDDNIQMCNVAQYQHLSNLSLLFNQLLAKIDKTLYFPRIYSFYQQLIYRLKIYPKSIPLMKIIRSLNAFISKTNWFNTIQNQKQINQLLTILSHFFNFLCDNIFKYQQCYFYQALKMLLSMPINVFLFQDYSILKHHLPNIINKSLQLGQQIITLAFQTINCLQSLFQSHKHQSYLYLSSSLPYLQKYINFNKSTQQNSNNNNINNLQQKYQLRSYLFLYQCDITRKQIANNVMKFLGSIGGICHLMVQNTVKDHISWDYYCKLDLTVALSGQNIDINLTKLLSRTCWLMLHGTQSQKIVSSEFMHAIMIYVIGKTATKGTTQLLQTKQNLSNFFDRVLPTLLSVASNPSHPSQQLIHTLIIQTIHFLANTQDPNSPDIQTLLKHILALYTGAEDMSFLASKCLSQLVKWHIKQSPQLQTYTYPLIKTVIRNIWSLISNKKARNGVLQFLIKFLKTIHRQEKLMTMYAIELCSLIISLGRTHKPIQPLLNYLITKYILSLKPYIKFLIIEDGSRRFRKLSTLQKLLFWIYNTSLFSIYKQQRTIAFILWQSILSKYSQSFNPSITQNPTKNIQLFLSEHVDKNKHYLFGQSQSILIDQDQPKLDKVLPKIIAYGQMWIKIVNKNIFQPNKISKFKDFQQVYLQSFSSFLQYLTSHFIVMQPTARILPSQIQTHILDSLLTFIELFLSLKPTTQFILKYLSTKISIYQKKRSTRSISLIQLLFKLLLRPNTLIPNFNFDLIYQISSNSSLLNQQPQKQTQHLYKQHQQTYYYQTFCNFLQTLLGNTLYPQLFKYIKSQLKTENIEELINYVVHQPTFYDREIKCVFSTLATLANQAGKDHPLFDTALRKTLLIITQQYGERDKQYQNQSNPPLISLSPQKKYLLIWYILQHLEQYSVIKDFMIAIIKRDTSIYQKNQKIIMKAIIYCWYGVNQKIILLAKSHNQFLKLIFVIWKLLPSSKRNNLYQLIQIHLINTALKESKFQKSKNAMQVSENSSKKKAQILSEMLKICFVILEDSQNQQTISPDFQNYLFDLILQGTDPKYSIDIHEQSFNLSGLIIKQHDTHPPNQNYPTFLQNFRKNIQTLTTTYAPLKLSKLPTPQSRHKCISYLKLLKSLIILSTDLKYLQFIFFLLKDPQLQPYHSQLLHQFLSQCLSSSYQHTSIQKQTSDLKWFINIYLLDNQFDKDPWNNIRVVVAEHIVQKIIPLTKIHVLCQFFQQHAEYLLNQYIKIPITPAIGTVDKIIFHMQLKRAAFIIIQQLYQYLPIKQKQTQQLHKKQLHKQFIKYCIQLLKSKFSQQILTIFKQYQQNSQKKTICSSYLRNLFCSSYNCLITIFISTQSNKQHFKTYLFQSKTYLWKHLLNQSQTTFQFQIQTNFPTLKPLPQIQPKFTKLIKDKYWSNSLYAIQQQYVPSSVTDNLPIIAEQKQNSQYLDNRENNANTSTNQIQQQQTIQLDTINKHPCMLNLLRVIDFMHEKFSDGTLPSWMKPLHDQLSSDSCPLSIRIFLTKLLLNKPHIFTQNIWPQILLKYLTLKQNGANFIHYFYRDTIKQFLTFVANGYKPNNISDINTTLMKLIRSLPYQNNIIYSDNIDIMQSLLKIQGVSINKTTITSMLKSTQKSKQQSKLKFQWRLCATIVLKSCLLYHVPILQQNQHLYHNQNQCDKFKFFIDMRKQGLLNLIFQMAGQTNKKYRIFASAFLGQYLSFLSKTQLNKSQLQQCIKLITKYLSNMTSSQLNRSTKQKFSISILHIIKSYPQLLNQFKLYNQIQSSLSIYNKQQRNHILQTIIYYCQYLVKNNVLGFIPHIFVSIRNIINKILYDIHQVQTNLLILLHQCCKQQILINKQVIDTYYYIYDDLDRVFSNTTHQTDSSLYYKILITLKDFTSDPDLPKTPQITTLNTKIHKNLLKGLGSQHESIKQLIFNVYQRQSKNYDDSALRMLDIIYKLYHPQFQHLWLVNVVPLILALVKNSSDYTRLRFEQSLGDLTAYYDWDFRKNIRTHSSQPYTPLFTLSTIPNQFLRRPDGTFQPTINQSLSGQKLKGILKASQNFYSSQQQQIFTILASQSQLASSPFTDSENSYQSSQYPIQYQSTKQLNRINNIFINSKKKRNKNMDQFQHVNINKYPTPLKIVNNKIRFNKSSQFKANLHDLHQHSNEHIPKTIGKGVLIRKYKVGQLPDIQITTKDLIDPMLYLATNDPQFASQLFVMLFIKLCFYSKKQKKNRFQQQICSLLKQSTKYQYNFISTLQKSLINLCQNLKQKLSFSLKQISIKSYTIDYGIIFTQQNQIQTLKQPDLQNHTLWQQTIYTNWSDLIDLYQHINQDDLIYGVLIKLAQQTDQRKLLLQALNLKKIGSIKQSQELFNVAFNQSHNKRIKQFITKEKIDCNTILGQWQPILQQYKNPLPQSPFSVNQLKTLTVALLNRRNELESQFFKKIKFHQTKNEYQKSILYIIYDKDFDMAYHHIQKSSQYFSLQWQKISSFAFSSKHILLQQIQKKYQLQQFLKLFRKDQIQSNQYQQLFYKWSHRQPNSIYDSNLTFLEILQSRILYSQLLSTKFKIKQQFLIKSKIDWLIQISNGMIQKGILGGAQSLIKKALTQKKKSQNYFLWDFYNSIAKLKLKQKIIQKCRNYSDYQSVIRVIKMQMDKNIIFINDIEKLKFISLKNYFIQGYLSSCLTFQDDINVRQFVEKLQIAYTNYQQIRKNLKQLSLSSPPSKQLENYRRDMYYKFTLFLEKILSLTNDKSTYPQIRQLMLKKNHNVNRYAHIFVQMLFNSIQISNFTISFQQLQSNIVFSLIMKLIKIIQMFPSQVGQYFAQTVTNKRIPIWIFLYFIPQMIKFINNPTLVTYFSDLFRVIATTYPQALIYHFNCSYQKQTERLTQFCNELHSYLKQKMQINYKFIQGLSLLQYPQLRLHQSLTKYLTIPYQRQSVISQLKQLSLDNPSLGKYNKKFIQDWQQKLKKLIKKIQQNDTSIYNDIKNILNFINSNKQDQHKSINFKMREFNKISDGCLFFEEYNANDWNRIEIPGTMYRKFQQPKPWKRVYIQSFDQSLLTLASKQRPKRITIYGSNQKKYMLLIKSGQDVRLDQRIQQLFQLMNTIIKNNSQCSKKQLIIHRFEVTPVKKMMGIFQWVNQSQTLKQFLQTQFKIIKESDKVNLKNSNKAFQIRMEFLKKLSTNQNSSDHYHQHKLLLSANKTQVIKCFQQCQKFIPYGLLRRALQRLSKNYDSFLHIKNTFIKNYSLISCITYILGIGDRHLQNFLLHMPSASLVAIDFGYSFGASLQLGVPQLIPFRLTKCFQQLMDPIGFQGLFKKCMIASFQAFAQNITLISDYCQVFVDDPLLQWVWTSKKRIQQHTNKSSQFIQSQQPPQKSLFSQKIHTVYNKLSGINPRIMYEYLLLNSKHKHNSYIKILIDSIWGNSKNRSKIISIPDVVDELISLATDKNLLGRTYVGWNPYV